ncbi:MAG: hypothetical protein ONB16_02020 [candidate division KSB1 bacterium]|nr:hypothetical protein [candidate division KSB1 bacterium]MDZ7317904.1 hypothetical protein [candidate division KSB1 bacterium]MDZ7339888.1 hypothetical protein [candidate division KSB1 bacterium]
MPPSKLALEIQLDLASISWPPKIELPYFEGELGGLHYSQHPTDPLSIEAIQVSVAPSDRLCLSLRGTGRLNVNNAPDVRIGGAKLRLEARLIFADGFLQLLEPELVKLDLPNLPPFADNMLRTIFNRHLIAALKDNLKIDLHRTLDKIQADLNQPIPITVSPDNYWLRLNLDAVTPDVRITLEGISVVLNLNFRPIVSRS